MIWKVWWPFKCLFFGAISLLLFAIIFVQMGYSIITTHSVPDGLWKTTQAPLMHGQIVSFCPPDTPVFQHIKATYGSGPCPGNYPRILKPIAALPGDTVELSEAGFRVNGKLLPNTKPLNLEIMGHPLPIYPFGTYKVAPNTIWLVSHYVPNSVDARYFGPLSMNVIHSPMKPVWTAYAP